jgi:type IV pilus assembly protein PilN
MIRINLLPREEKAHAEVGIALPRVGDLVVPALLLVITVLAIAGTAVAQRMQLQNLERSIAAVDEQSRALQPQIARVNQLAKERAELDLRLGIIAKLDHGRTDAVRLMDNIARCIPDHVWLTSAQNDNGTLSLEGEAFSMLGISDLISRLEQSGSFSNVQLESAVREKDESVTVDFKVTCQITSNPTAN